LFYLILDIIPIPKTGPLWLPIVAPISNLLPQKCDICYIYEAVLSQWLSVNSVHIVLIGDGSTYTREDLAV